jgi:hypothetical protein
VSLDGDRGKGDKIKIVEEMRASKKKPIAAVKLTIANDDDVLKPFLHQRDKLNLLCFAAHDQF